MTVWIALLAISMCAETAAAEEEHPGAAIYRRLCADCHGAEGEGVEESYSEPLVGDRSAAQLAELIAETMPEDDPDQCVGDDARQVAEYIHATFYSPAAQIRNQPPRVELSRLTVNQYRQTVTDLVAGPRNADRWDDERGLRGEYFNERRFKDDRRVIERRDAVVNFQFGEKTPEDNDDPESEFSARWRGSVLALETGEYEFILETENGARLWVNDDEQPLIDAWVKSGDQTEYRQTIFLLGGRTYRLRLEFFKYKQKTASIALKWKPPHQAEELVPERQLAPHDAKSKLVIATPFPPDDRSVGYERGTSVSKAWDQATTQAAVETADYVLAHLPRLADCPADAKDRAERLQKYCRDFAGRAFRRPLNDEEQKFFIERQFEAAEDLETAVKRVVLLTLKSPRFLYRELAVEPDDPYTVAARLSFALWDSLPDEQLRSAAEKKQLATREQVAKHAERMGGDLRTRAKLRDFFHHWLRFDHLEDISKDAELFGEFGPELISDLRTSLDLFVDEVAWSERSDFRDLLLAEQMYFNGRLAQYYGAKLPSEAGFEKIAFEPEQRAGVLTHPFLMAGFAYHATSSPIHRGVFVTRSVLGRGLRPPPEAVAPLAPELHADLTTRERIKLQTSPAACQTCHSLINPLGFSFEHFDAVGRYRKTEKEQPIDAQGGYTTDSGERVEFRGARELAAFLADNEETHQAFVDQLFHHMIKQPIAAFGLKERERLRKQFAEEEFRMRTLLEEIAISAALPPSPSAE